MAHTVLNGACVRVCVCVLSAHLYTHTVYGLQVKYIDLHNNASDLNTAFTKLHFCTLAQDGTEGSKGSIHRALGWGCPLMGHLCSLELSTPLPLRSCLVPLRNCVRHCSVVTVFAKPRSSKD